MGADYVPFLHCPLNTCAAALRGGAAAQVGPMCWPCHSHSRCHCWCQPPGKTQLALQPSVCEPLLMAPHCAAQLGAVWDCWGLRRAASCSASASAARIVEGRLPVGVVALGRIFDACYSLDCRYRCGTKMQQYNRSSKLLISWQQHQSPAL